jgi:phosphoribosylglycinamide formyltransferase-1
MLTWPGMDKIKLAILISGRGSNMQALIKACEDPDFPAQIELVISNIPNAEGLKKARSHDIPTCIVAHKEYETKAGFESALNTALGAADVDYICLAGFMRLLSAEFVNRWPLRIINIHPSLLPAYKGLNVHRRVIDDKQKLSGCTVHFVVPEMDAGPVILQKTVPVHEGDTPQSLADRILAEEHAAYPEAIRMIAENRVEIIDGMVKIS